MTERLTASEKSLVATLEAAKANEEAIENIIPRAAAIVSRLSDFWDELAVRVGEGGAGEFFPEIFGPMWRDGPPGSVHEKEIKDWDSQSEEMKPFGILAAAFTSCGYAIDAMKSRQANEIDLAWRHLCKAEYWLGITVGSWSVRSAGMAISAVGTLGADKRYAEHRAMKADVFKWLDEHLKTYKSLDSAAEAIAGKIVPIKFRTAREWVGAYKKLRSTGTP